MIEAFPSVSHLLPFHLTLFESIIAKEILLETGNFVSYYNVLTIYLSIKSSFIFAFVFDSSRFSGKILSLAAFFMQIFDILQYLCYYWRYWLKIFKRATHTTWTGNYMYQSISVRTMPLLTKTLHRKSSSGSTCMLCTFFYTPAKWMFLGVN